MFKEIQNQNYFDYHEAFSRNIGFITPSEMLDLKKKKVAIAGMGGVGGLHLITLVRLGVTKFHIADFDTFDLANFNRQAGANMETLGKSKVDVMEEQARSINPEVKIYKFSEGVTLENQHEFLEGVDLFVDGFDVFVLEVRREVFMECHRRKIPAITVGPIGMGFSLVNFLPEKMSFDSYWKFVNKFGSVKLDTFIDGLTPGGLHFPSLVYSRAFDLKNGRTASTPMGCLLATGVMGTEALKILLKRGKVLAAPYSIHYDGYTYRLKKTYLLWGTQNPLLSIKKILGNLMRLIK